MGRLQSSWHREVHCNYVLLLQGCLTYYCRWVFLAYIIATTVPGVITSAEVPGVPIFVTTVPDVNTAAEVSGVPITATAVPDVNTTAENSDVYYRS